MRVFFFRQVPGEGVAWAAVCRMAVEADRAPCRNCGWAYPEPLWRMSEDPRLVVGVQARDANMQFVLARFSQEKDATAVGARGTDGRLPGIPRRQIDLSSATAELWNHPEKTHVEVSHQHVDAATAAEFRTPVPEVVQLPWPLAVRKDVVHVHGHEHNLVFKMSDTFVELNFADHATRVLPALLELSFESPLPVHARQALRHIRPSSH